MIGPTATSTATLPFAQDTSQPHPYPFVQRCKRVSMTVLEVLKPALQRGIEILNRHSQTLAIGAPGFLTDRVLHLLQTLLPRPTESPFEVISQEVEATRLGSIDNPCLFRMQRQARRSGPFLHPGQRLTRFLLAATQQHEVVRIPDHLHPALSHEMVQRIEIEIRQQGADHRTLRRALLRRPEFVRFPHRLLQECCDQVQHPTIGNILPHPRQHRRLRNRVEVAPQIRIHDPVIALIQELLDTTKCVFRTALWPKPITVFGELPLEDGFHHLPQSSLHHPVAHGGNPQRPRFAAPWFRNPHAANRLRLVRARPQLFRNLIQVLFQAFFKILHRHSIHSRRTAVGFHFSESALQIGGVPHLINQTEPTPPFHPLFEGCQHPLAPHRWFRPCPTDPNFSGLLSQLRHFRRLLFHRRVAHESTSLRPFAPDPLRSFLATTDALTPARLSVAAQVSRLHVTWPSRPSASNHLCIPRDRFHTLPFNSTGVPLARVWASPFTRRLTDCTGRIEFLSCGWAVHLQLLFTPPPGGAITVDFRPESVCRRGTLTLLSMCACRRTGAATCRRFSPFQKGAKRRKVAALH